MANKTQTTQATAPDTLRSMLGYMAQMAPTPTYEIVSCVSAVATAVQRVMSNYTTQVGVVGVTLYFQHEVRKTSALTEHKLVESNTLYVLAALRPLVRKTDIVCVLNNNVYVILPGTNLQGANIVQSRLWDALLWHVHNMDETEHIRPTSMTIGHSAYPVPFATINACVEAANEVNQSFASEHISNSAKNKLRSGTLSGMDEQRPAKDGELSALARQLGIPYLSWLPRKLPKQVRGLVTPSLAQELHCYPLGKEHGMLTVALSNPEDNRILDRLRQETGLHIFPVLTHPQELQMALEQLL